METSAVTHIIFTVLYSTETSVSRVEQSLLNTEVWNDFFYVLYETVWMASCLVEDNMQGAVER